MKRCLSVLLLAAMLFLFGCRDAGAPLSGAATSAAASTVESTVVTTTEAKAEKTGKAEKTAKTKNAEVVAAATERTDVEQTAAQATTTKKTRRTTTKRQTTTAANKTQKYTYLTSARASEATEKRSFAETVKVACVGDSITKNGYWENNLQGALSNSYVVEGFGVNGATALYFGMDNGDFKAYVDQPEYRESLSAGADIVVIMLGTNDAKGYNWVSDMDNPRQFIIDTTDLVRSYQQSASAPTVFLALPPTVFKEFAGITNEVVEGSVIPALRQVAADTGAILIDTHAATKDAAEHFTDGVHPSDLAGKKCIADAVAAAITAHVGKK